MKKTSTLILAAFFILFHVNALATDWGKPDKGYFSTQKDIEDDVSNLSASMATISFGGKLFNFINYNDGSNSKIIVRKLSNSATDGVKWSVTKQDDITNLKKLSAWQEWQPAPVVFNEVLYLFVSVQEGSDYQHAYVNFTKYNSGDDSWTKPQKVPGNIAGVGYMAAAVLGDKLCLIVKGTDNNAAIYTTTDLVSWTTLQTDFAPLNEISVIVKSFLETKSDGTQKLNSKLVIGYLNSNSHAKCAEYQFNASGQLTKTSSQTISTDLTYQSIVLADGSVYGDASTGSCVQAFLKKDSKDNGYCRYRIQRYQSISGGDWTKQENNLVKQNYLWADKNLNMTGATFAVNDGKNSIKQYMCLIYRGYDDWDHPLNCAYVETDYLTLIGEAAETLSGPENTQYVGYIEGPPPFYRNINDSTYNDPQAAYISELEYANTVANSSKQELGFEVEVKASGMFHGFSASASYAFGQQWDSETEEKKTTSVAIHGAKETRGYYLKQQPKICRATYGVYDVHNKYLYSTYYFFMKQPSWLNTSVEGLQDGLESFNPETFMNRGINFDLYDNFDNQSVSWTEGLDASGSIEVSTSSSLTNTQKVKVDLGKEWGEEHIWNVGIELEGTFEYETTTTTLNGDEINCHTRLNDAVRPTDVTDLAYNVWWLKRTDGLNNWWLYPGQDITQNTWCVTYEVTYLKYKNGKQFGDPDGTAGKNPGETESVRGNRSENDQVSQNGFSLSQNSPNPFNPTTKIKYQVGIENPNTNSSDNSCLTKLVVYNLNGQEVATLVNENKAPGNYEVEWDASQLTPGVYFYSLQSGNFKDVKKLIRFK